MPASSRRPPAEALAPGRPRHATPDHPDTRLLRAVADPSRLAILRRLQCGGSVAACDLDCCEVRQPTVSHHLRVLREAGWVRAERHGSRVFYSMEPGSARRFRQIAVDLARPSHGRGEAVG